MIDIYDPPAATVTMSDRPRDARDLLGDALAAKVDAEMMALAPRRMPKVGDEVWYVVLAGAAPIAAKVVHVWSDTCVNLEGAESGILYSSVLVRDHDLDGENMAGANFCVLMDLNDRDEQPPMLAVDCAIVRLEAARALPEVEPDSVSHPINFVPSTIQRFRDEDGRTMHIVALAGSLWKQECK